MAEQKNNEIETEKNTVRKIHESQRCFLDMIDEFNKTLTKLIRKKKKKRERVESFPNR